MSNRIKLGTPEALTIEAFDQAATAVAAFHAGVGFPGLSLTEPREDGWRYRDELWDALAELIERDRESPIGLIVPYVGSAAQHIALNDEHPLETVVEGLGDAKLPAHDFVRAHWREIDAIAKALLERRELPSAEVAAMLRQ